jgi:cytochrome c oxidase subunit 2
MAEVRAKCLAGIRDGEDPAEPLRSECPSTNGSAGASPSRRLLALLTLLLAGCKSEFDSTESAWNPAGPGAHQIGVLTWVFTGVCVVVFVIIMLILLGCFIHRRHGEAMVPTNTPIEPDEASDARVWRPVFAGIVVTTIVLFGLMITDFATGRSLHKIGQGREKITVKVIGHQWWWEVQYIGWPERFGEAMPSNVVNDANEIHVPVDPQNPVAVELQLESHDVIHSFWAPNLHGKKDLIPGHDTTLVIQADKPGFYWGECAEFCGYQHANMRLAVIAEPVDQFRAWLEAQRQEAPVPQTEQQSRGRAVFLASTCVTCHSIGGTLARGRVGPDLTHVASRPLLAAGALPNTKGDLGGWIVDPQRLKPGTQMPQNNLAPDDLKALLDYLMTLK